VQFKVELAIPGNEVKAFRKSLLEVVENYTVSKLLNFYYSFAHYRLLFQYFKDSGLFPESLVASAQVCLNTSVSEMHAVMHPDAAL
jgi:hypothetical protein